MPTVTANRLSLPYRLYAGALLLLFVCVLALGAPRPVQAKGTLADYRKAMTGVIAEFNQRSAKAFDRTVDADTIIDTAMSGAILEPTYKLRFSTGLKKGIGNVGKLLLKQMPEGLTAKVIRVKQGSKAVLALVRLDYGDAGWGYMDFWLNKDKRGKVRIVDWYDFATGQLYTASLRQVAVISAPTPTSLGKAFDIVTGRAEDTRMLSKFIKAKVKGKYKESYSFFRKMDRDMKKNRIVAVLAVSSASQSGDDALYKEALANLAQHHGNDPTLAFLLLDHYFLTKRYDKAITILKGYQASFGAHDGAIDGMLANSYMMSGNTKRAAYHASQGIKKEPNLENNYWTLFHLHATNKQYPQAVKAARQLEDRFNYNLGPEILKKEKDYHPLVKSAAYRKWRGI